MDERRYVGIVEIRITPQYVRNDGVLVSEGGEIAIDNLADQTDLDLLKYARNALAEEINAREEFVPSEYGQLLRRVESWPWERFVFPVGTLVRPRDGGPEARVVLHGVDGILVGGSDGGFFDPWDLVPVDR